MTSSIRPGRSARQPASKGFALRLPETLLEELRREATAEHRSLNAHIVSLLERRRRRDRDAAYDAALALRGAFPGFDERSVCREGDDRRQQLLDELWRAD